MRRKFIAGNWKMNLDRKAAVALAEAVAREAEKSRGRSGGLPAGLLPRGGGPGDQGLQGGPGRPERLSPAQWGVYGRNQHRDALRPGGQST